MGRVSRLLGMAGAMLLLALGSQALAYGPCHYSADEAFRACKNQAWADFHINRGKCVNNAEFTDLLECRRSFRVREALDLCEAQHEERLRICGILGGWAYDPPFDPEDFVDLEAKGVVQNPYWSLEPGYTAVIVAGEEGEELNVVTVTDRIREVEGVPCRVVVDVVLEPGGDEGDEEEKGAPVEYDAVEATDDWYALHVNGDVWYCGERSRNYEDGELVDLGGSFEAGQDGAKPGILIRANPVEREFYRQEFLLGEAEDVARVQDLATSPPDEEDKRTVRLKNGAFECNDECLRTRESSALEPDGYELKFYIPGVGFILAIAYEDGEPTGEREMVQCIGDSLDVLDDPSCGIEDPDALREALCDVAPDTFCADEE